MRPAGGAYRIRTGVNGLEGRCATAAPILRIVSFRMHALQGETDPGFNLSTSGTRITSTRYYAPRVEFLTARHPTTAAGGTGRIRTGNLPRYCSNWIPRSLCPIIPPGLSTGGQVFPCSQDKCTTTCSRWRRMTESNRPPGRGNNPDRPSCAILPVCPGCHALLTSALPPCSPYGGAGLSLQSENKKKGVIHFRGVRSRMEGRVGFEPTASRLCCRSTSACASRP